ncbi:type I-F CRISPR-associated protein Csy2 [Pseudomonas sp. LRF_L74]|uniref:type I-F CRISPR-associated protein Csy2 n=1 Tax=Pseudomonas sp. LRF_L74 TaxID=3369422 RepID=UPI003F634CEB
MSDLPDSNGLLILPHLRVQNANAISSPLTWGFPAVSAFIGLMHALERRLAGRFNLMFDSIGIICHSHDAQVTEGYQRAFRLTRNPVNEKGETAAIVEEGRIHLDITLLFAVSGYAEGDQDNPLNAERQVRRQIAHEIAEELAGMRIAGGSVFLDPQHNPSLLPLATSAEARSEQFRRLHRHWLPGFALVCRDDLLSEHLDTLREENDQADLLDAWLDLSRLNIRATPPTRSDRVEWRAQRAVPNGWIVPIPVGYGALSPLQEAGSIANSRDPHTPGRFVESLYSIGQWLSPHRLRDVEDLLWFASADPHAGLYRCHNLYAQTRFSDDKE